MTLRKGRYTRRFPAALQFYASTIFVLPGVINILHDEIRERGASQLSNKNATILCNGVNRVCQHSALGTQALPALEYRRVVEYVAGEQDCKAVEYPL